jgi:hypothetical protein
MPLPLAASAIIFDFDTLMLCHYFIDWSPVIRSASRRHSW